jgi:hypothetical protein
MGFKYELDCYLYEETLDMHAPNFKVLVQASSACSSAPTPITNAMKNDLFMYRLAKSNM